MLDTVGTLSGFLRRNAGSIITVLVLLFSVTGANLSHTLEDTFHEGEYLGALHHIKAFSNGTAPFPLLVHGGIDYLPVLAAEHIYGPSYTIAGTRIINTLLTGAVWAMFSVLLLLVVPRGNRNILAVVLFLVIFILLSPAARAPVVSYHQAFINLRSLLFLPVILLSVLSLRPAGRVLQAASISFAGLFCVLSLFWNYLDGIAATLFLTIICAGLIAEKRFMHVAWCAGSALAALLLLHILAPDGFIVANLNNVLFWARHGGGVFGADGSGMINFYYRYVVFVCIAAAFSVVLVLGWMYREALRQVLAAPLWFAGALAVSTACFVFADPSRHFHSSRFVWQLLITSFFLLQVFPVRLSVNWQAAVTSRHFGTQHNVKVLVVVFAAAMVLALDPVQRLHTARSFVKNCVAPRADSLLVPPDMRRVAAVMRKAGGGSYFSWNNDGVMAYLTHTSFVGGMPNIFYISPDYQGMVLEMLKRESPQAILYTSPNYYFTHWSRVSMPLRFPRIDAYLRNQYPIKIVVGAYMVLAKEGAQYHE